MHVQAHHPQDLSELERRIAAQTDARQRDRYRTVRLALAGEECPVIQEKLGRSKDFVQSWVYAYRDGGLDALRPKKQPGRQPKLSKSQQAALAARLDAGPRPEDGACTLRGKQIVALIQREFGVRYSLGGAYDLLQRLGYSYLRPRPRHPKNDPLAMAQFRRDAPLLSSGSKRSIPT
jgi:transposase